LDQQETHRIIERIKCDPLGFAFDTESDGEQLVGKKMLNVYKSHLVGFSISFIKDGEAHYFPYRHGDGDVWIRVKPILEAISSTTQPVWAHNWKHDAKVLEREGLRAPSYMMDSMIMMWLLGLSANGSYGLKALAKTYLKWHMSDFKEVLGTCKTWADVPLARAEKYGKEDSIAVQRLVNAFYFDMEPRLRTHMRDVEMPMVLCLKEMEDHGVMIDTSALSSLKDELSSKVSALIDEWEFLFPDILISSSVQVSRHFYGNGLWSTDGVPVGKNGLHSTGRKHVEQAKATCKAGSLGYIGADIRLQYQDLNKYLSTFTGTLVEQAQQHTDGRLRCSFKQHGTATGRLSCSGPNLQNIPARSNYGQLIRKAFVAPPGKVLVVADYSQIELRILAHLATSRIGTVGKLAQAYKEGADIHQQTADLVGCTRQQAKTINFATVYGARGKKLAEQLDVDLDTAENFLARYKESYPEVFELKEIILKEAYEKGKVLTLGGRYRLIPQLVSARTRDTRHESWADRLNRWFGERIAFNTPVQGGAADLVKMSMLKFRETAQHGGTHMVSQVHDEIIVECDEEHARYVAWELQHTMENITKLHVPLVAEPSVGRSWGDCK
jgi:DNA polymerase-1